MKPTHYQLNGAEVAAKALEGEVLVINLHNGTYYSMEGSAALVWVMLEQGCSVGQCLGTLVEHWKLAPEPVEAELTAFLQQLVEERILAPAAAPGSDPEFRMSEHAESLGNLPDRYAPPRLTVFDDMSDLLALDPPMPKVPL